MVQGRLKGWFRAQKLWKYLGMEWICYSATYRGNYHQAPQYNAPCLASGHTWYRLVSNIRRSSNIRRTPTLGNSKIEFSPTISLVKTSNTRGTPSFDSWVSIVDKVWSRPTWSGLLRVAWDFDSPWITGPMTAHQSVAYVRHVTLAPAAKLCAIVFLPIKAWVWRHLRRYIEGSAILLTCQGTRMTEMTKDFAMRHDENYVE